MSSSVHGADQEKDQKKKAEDEKVEKVPFMKLFSFADRWDYVLMAVGSVGACAHGASVPVFFIFFGKLINIIGLASLFPTTVSGRVAKYSLDFVYLGVVILFSSWTEVACWMHTGERQAAKMRLAYLRSMLDQDIAVFDTEASTGEVINAITSDILVVQDAISEKGDQASIVGGAIDFVKELEQQLQSLEAQKRRLSVHHQQQQQHKASRDSTMPPSHAAAAHCAESTSNCSSGVTESDASEPAAAAPFAGFFTYPQYVWLHSPRDSAATLSAEESRAGVADIEVNLVETHASVHVMSPRRPGQLLRMVAGLQALRLTVLHLNVTALDSLVLYSLSVKVEEGCGLTTADDIAAAVHHVLCFIHAETTASQQLLAAAQ